MHPAAPAPITTMGRSSVANLPRDQVEVKGTRIAAPATAHHDTSPSLDRSLWEAARLRSTSASASATRRLDSDTLRRHLRYASFSREYQR
jgi:hypothetical protein